MDDQESWCFVVQTALLQQGYLTEAFTDPWQFLQVAEQFDLAIIDYSLPPPRHRLELDGCALIQRVKTQVARPPLMILISSYFPVEDLNNLKTFCSEADWILQRPMEIQALLRPIEALFAQRNKPRSKQTWDKDIASLERSFQAASVEATELSWDNR